MIITVNIYMMWSLYLLLLVSTTTRSLGATFNQYTKEDLYKYREEVRDMFQHSYNSYLEHAYPYDELRPLSCDGMDTWGSYSLTLIDALDTLAVMGNYSEFSRVYNIIAERTDFDANINVSVFETNIRIVGGLISAHLLARRAGVPVSPGWPCTGPLLSLAEDVVQRLLPAFDTPTGMPYGTVNLRHGVPEGETPITCTAGVGTYIVEFGALSRLTGNPLYEETAMRAMRALWHHRSTIGLLGNHIDVLKGKWTAVEAGIGAGVDSYYEYLVKGASLLQRPELMTMFNVGREAVEQYLNKDDWHFWVNMKNGQVTMPLFQNLEAFWPGTLSKVGDIQAALKSLHNYHQVWKQYGFTPEFYNVAQGGVAAQREGYPLRPELIESIMYLYRATGDPWLVDAGVDILKSIQHSAWTPCGYATVKNVLTHTLEDRMESFFLAETTKYLYLMFDPDNFIHNRGNLADVVTTPSGTCTLDAGGYIFNTEAHPIDPAALQCCSGLSEKEIKSQIANQMIDIMNPGKIKEFKGDLVPERIKMLEKKRQEEARQKKEREKKIREQLELLRVQAQEAAAEQKRKEEEKRKLIQEAREERENKSVDPNKVQTNNDTEFDLESDDDIEDDGEDAENKPEFSAQKEAHVPSDTPKHEKAMITRLSRGEVMTDHSTPSPGIVQPEKMVNVFEKKANVVVEAISSLVQQFLPVESVQFDLDKFSARVQSGQWPLEQSWLTDYEAMSCPAVKFTDRFLMHGEFFEEPEV